MAGIYIHIPYCRKACTYCNFHFSTNLQHKQKLVNAVVKEISLQKQYLGSSKINTIYFGGGTPSVLTKEELKQIMDALQEQYSIANDAEVTFEINPDDAKPAMLHNWKELGINRLSIGIQSFDDTELNFMNRSHTAAQSLEVVHLAKEADFENISIDLIYGGYKTSNEDWKRNIDTFLAMDIPHLSAYALTVEDKTQLGHSVQSGKLLNPDEQKTIEQFEILMDKLEAKNYEHYEISNFAIAGRQAKHNGNYWTGQKYLGIGPAAHSFNGKTRQWNVANNLKYISSIAEETIPAEKEILSPNDLYNEHIMTGLRTSNGCNRKNIDERFDSAHLAAFDIAVEKQMEKGNVIAKESAYVLTRKGKFIADSVMADFFV